MDPDGVFSPPENARAVLVVDDDVQVLKGVCRMLASIGCSRIFPAKSPAEAVEFWRMYRFEIGVLVSDFVMPEVTGDRLALQFLDEKPALKVLFISGNDPSNLDSAIPLENGHNFLQKPFTVSEIRRSVGNLALAV